MRKNFARIGMILGDRRDNLYDWPVNVPRNLSGDAWRPKAHEPGERKVAWSSGPPMMRRPRNWKARIVVLTLIAATALGGLGLYQVFRGQDAEKLAEFLQERYTAGTYLDLEAAALQLERELVRHDSPGYRAALALVRTQQFVEFGARETEARAAVSALGDTDSDEANLARALLAAADGQLEQAERLLQELPQSDAGKPTRVDWLRAFVRLQRGAEGVKDAQLRLGIAVEHGAPVSYRRLLARALLQGGQGPEALAELSRAREEARTHLGLAGDEVLFNVILRQKLVGVRDLAVQLLQESQGLAPGTEAHAKLAEGAVMVLSGEHDAGMELVAAAWQSLPRWDVLASTLALEMALEAGDEARASAWLSKLQLEGEDADILRAWSLLVAGDVMACLELSAKLPQDHPRVALIQGLALVEQQRWEEALPWLELALKRNPGRVELDVALARVELRNGDRRAALRKLEVLSQDEPFAPRIWTALGEAHLELIAVAPDNTDPRELARHRAMAQTALERAVKQERRPAEAMVRLAEIWTSRRREDPEAAQKSLELLEQAVKINDRLPRYKERLGLALDFLGYRKRSLELLAPLVLEPGVRPETIVATIRQQLEASQENNTPLPSSLESWFEQAEALSADAGVLRAQRAQLALIRGDQASLRAALQKLEAASGSRRGVEEVVLLAKIHAALGDRERAVVVLRRGLHEVPETEHGPLYMEIARNKAHMGKRKGAIVYARNGWDRMMKERRPAAELIDATQLVSHLYLRLEKPESASHVVLRLSHELPHHADAWALRSRVQLKTGEPSNALRAASHGVELDPENPRAQEALGFAAVRLGERERAMTAFKAAKQHYREQEDKARMDEQLGRL